MLLRYGVAVLSVALAFAVTEAVADIDGAGDFPVVHERRDCQFALRRNARRSARHYFSVFTLLSTYRCRSLRLRVASC